MVGRVAGHAYPWDVLDDPSFAGRARDLGVDTVTMAASYHSTRAATPLHPRHQVVAALDDRDPRTDRRAAGPAGGVNLAP